MGRVYSAAFTGVAVSAAQDFFEIVAPADSVVRLLSCSLAQSSDVGDAAEELLRVNILRGATSSGSGGSSPTVAPHNFGDAAFGGTVEANNTTIASAGTIVALKADAFNIRAGWQYVPTPEECIYISPSQRLTIQLMANPADAVTMEGTVTFEEIGG